MSRVIKAYKILKTYPTLNKKLKVGDYLTKVTVTVFNTIQMYEPQYAKEDEKGILLGQSEVEDNPEFFKKVNLQIIVKEIEDDK